MLGKIHADIQAALTASLQIALQAVLGEGVLIKQPRVELDREGTPVTLTYIDSNGQKAYIYDYQSNPAFKPIADLVSRLGLSMGDLGLTVRATENKDEDTGGMLTLDAESKETLAEFNARMAKATEAMGGKLGRAQQRMRNDPVLIEHQAQSQAEPKARGPRRRNAGKAAW